MAQLLSTNVAGSLSVNNSSVLMNVNAGIIQSNTANLLVQTIVASNANVVLSANGTANAVLTNTGNLQLTSGNLVTTYNVLAGNVLATQINVSLLNVSTNANVSYLSVSHTANIAANLNVVGNAFIQTLNVYGVANIAGAANLPGLISVNTVTAAQGTMVVATANQNFNNSAYTNALVTANGTQANVAFNVNVNSVTGLITTANSSNIVLTYSATGATIDTRVPAGGGGGAYQVDVYDNAGLVLANAQTQFVNSATINAIVAANGTTGANISMAVNASSLVVGTTNGAVYANGTLVVTGANVNFNNTLTINVVAAANGTTQSNVAFNVNTSLNLVSVNVTGNIQTANMLLLLAPSSPPTLLVANTLGMYAVNIAAMTFQAEATTEPNNALVSVDTIRQHHIGYKSIYWIRPGNTSACTSGISNVSGANDAFSCLGCTANIKANSITFMTPSNANIFNTATMMTLGTSNIGTSNAQVMANSNLVWGGSTANGGGYFGVFRFGHQNVAPAVQNTFVGLANIVAQPTAQTDWMDNTAFDVIGLCSNGATTDWNFIVGTAGAARTITNLGANFPVANAQYLELTVHVQPGGAVGGYRVRNLSNGGQVQGAITTNLPTANHFMNPIISLFNGQTAQSNISIASIYLEEDF